MAYKEYTRETDKRTLKTILNFMRYTHEVLGDAFNAQKQRTIIKQIYSMKKFLTASQEFENVDEIGLMIVSGKQRDLSYVQLCNTTATVLLGYKKDILLSNKVALLVPHFYRDNYSYLWRRFYNSGSAGFIEKKHFTFVTNESGYLLPVVMAVKFYNENAYEDSFIAMFKPPEEIAPFDEEQEVEGPINVQSLVFLITD